MKKIGLLGGTFDPPHIGHLIIADDVYHELGLDEVWFIPSQIPPHKNAASVSADKRLEMVEKATSDRDYFFVKGIELQRTGPSYTIDTIKQLKELYPDIDFYFIIGADMVEYLPQWQAIDELIHAIQFVGVKRPGFDLVTPYPVRLVDSLVVDISSSDVRSRIKARRPVRYLLPESVDRYIREHKLYE